MHTIDDDDDGWAGAFLVEPLTALAGGLVGGIIVGVIVWRSMWRHAGWRRHPIDNRGVPA